MTGRALVLLALIGIAAGAGKCKVSKVRATCESRCEQDTRAIDRTSVPPPGTLLPPSGLPSTTEEGASATTPPASTTTPADSTAALLELEAVTITKRKDGTFKEADAEAATLHTNPNLNKATSARMLFPQVDMENLGELDMTHFAQLEAPPTMLHKPMSCDEVEQHISPVPLLSWVDTKTASFGCADGRDAKNGLFTWGGDFAEFATALNVYEQMATIHLSRADVTQILRQYLTASNRERFTTCISALAVRQMFGSTEDAYGAIRNPAEEKLPALELKIADSNFVGNEHIKFMLDASDEYSVRKELVQHLIRSFYHILWNPYDPLRNKLNVQVLPGDHNERAVVTIASPEFCVKQAELSPAVAPRQPAGSAVIINADAVQSLRKELAVFFSRVPSPVVRADEMAKRFSVLSAGQAALTKKRMYDRIPTYTAKISE